MRRLALGLSCLMLLAGCATAGGVRVEGVASQVTPPPSTPPPPSGVTPSFDPVALLRTDPKVNDKIKSVLTPCPQGGRFPVDARYVELTGDDVAELLVSVTYCDASAALGKTQSTYDPTRGTGTLANYVYDVLAKPPVDLLALEEPGIIVARDNGVVQVISWEYGPKDRTCCTSEISHVYRWTGTMFERIK
jgi:hypothetical protein